MTEHWLRANRRVASCGAVGLGLVALAGLMLAAGWFTSPPAVAWRSIGAALAGVAGLGLVGWWFAAGSPRLSYRDGYLLVRLRLLWPIRVPIDVVECFFMGQGPDPVVGRLGKKKLETIHVVMRLAERDRRWHEQQVHPWLGSWCGGYATFYGTWCQRLSVDRVNELNERLRITKGRFQAARRSGQGVT